MSAGARHTRAHARLPTDSCARAETLGAGARQICGRQQARHENGNTRRIATIKKQDVRRQNDVHRTDGIVEISDSSDQALDVRPSPLPTLSWGSSEDVWVKMLSKEMKYKHNKNSLCTHPSVQPKMRAVVLDWLMEVCESYTLHRQTFYLAQDYFDRFMSTQNDVQKDRLQLVGITALFVASKIEEIYPPRISELAFVTDGACLEEDILQMELIMLKALNWDLYPETVVSWMKLYIQMASVYDFTDPLVPQFAQGTYIQITQLLDLCILDINSLDFKYGVLAAAAFCHFTSVDEVKKVSGLRWEAMETCVNWMAPFAETVMCYEKAQLKDLKVSCEDRHNIQTHVDYLSMLKETQQKQSESLNHSFPPTPPSSSEKPS
ncbi:G1/S-specific cyclin-E2 [Triplophysa tibetana]|uniref:G1/S-specific cyclin-E2 n=1 Tax=Triplophysa tibetana TaxID=1572043 RepID=A0A5A9NP21_9TELE|nr:G1/S-specific cyclin-E2 [Triplophysa tibetana]